VSCQGSNAASLLIRSHGGPAADRQALSSQPADDLFIQLVKYLDENPEAENAEILGRWAGTPEHDTLLGLLRTPLGLSATEIQAELAAGVENYLALQRRAQRRQTLAEVRQEPSRENFQRYWSALKQGVIEGDA